MPAIDLWPVSAVIVDGELAGWFMITVGVRYGWGLSPYLFNVHLEAMMSFALIRSII